MRTESPLRTWLLLSILVCVVSLSLACGSGTSAPPPSSSAPPPVVTPSPPAAVNLQEVIPGLWHNANAANSPDLTFQPDGKVIFQATFPPIGNMPSKTITSMGAWKVISPNSIQYSLNFPDGSVFTTWNNISVSGSTLTAQQQESESASGGTSNPPKPISYTRVGPAPGSSLPAQPPSTSPPLGSEPPSPQVSSGSCDNLPAQDSFQCWSDKYEKADAELNAVWKKLMTSLNERQKQELRARQREWLKGIAAIKNEDFGAAGGGGANWPAIALQYKDLAQRTAQRTEELKKLLPSTSP